MKRLLLFSLLAIEPFIAIYLIYLWLGVWWVLGIVIFYIVILFLLVWITDTFYVKSDIFKENAEYKEEEFKAINIFSQWIEYILFFPAKAIIISYIYFVFDNATLFISLYLLLIIIKESSWRSRNIREIEREFSKLKVKSDE